MTYYYAQSNLDIIYYTYDDHEQEHYLYFNDKKVATQEGVLGQKILEYEDIKLDVTNKLTKSTRILTVEGKELSLTKVRKKNLQELLTSKNIYNDVNPTAEEREASKFKFNSLLMPGVFLAIAMVIEYFTHNKETVNRILFIAIPCFLAGGSLYGTLTSHVRFF